MSKPVVAVHKFSSCDGCQLAFLNMGEDLLTLAELVDIHHFAEAGALNETVLADIAFIEGSISTPHDIERLKETFGTLTISEQFTEGPLPLAAEKQWKNIFEDAQGKVDTMVKGSTGDIEALTLAINFEEKSDLVRPFIEEFGLTFEVLYDTQAKVSQLYQVTGLPRTIFVDRQGVIQHIQIGEVEETLLTEIIEKIL